MGQGFNSVKSSDSDIPSQAWYARSPTYGLSSKASPPVLGRHLPRHHQPATQVPIHLHKGSGPSPLHEDGDEGMATGKASQSLKVEDTSPTEEVEACHLLAHDYPQFPDP